MKDHRYYFMINLRECISTGIELNTPESAIELHKDCATGPGHLGIHILSKWALNSIMELLSCLNSVFALFDCFGARLYELLIARLMDTV